MTRVLIVDDEPGYCEGLAATLRATGDFELRTATDGQEAIDLGLRFRPQVLVADWMLKTSVDGLVVSEALQSVECDVHTVLMSGYASADLRHEASSLGVGAFLEKPFDADTLKRAICKTSSRAEVPRNRVSVGLLDSDRLGGMHYANARATELLRSAGLSELPENLKQVLGAEAAGQVELSARQWVDVTVGAGEVYQWRIRSRYWADDEMYSIVVLDEATRSCRSHPVVRLLVGEPRRARVMWPHAGHVIVIDDYEIVRRAVSERLRAAHCLCHAAESGATGLRLLDRDPDVQYVILDYDVPGTDLRWLVDEIRSRRPDVTLVGLSGNVDREAFETLGIELFLPKPFSVEQLINLTTGRLGNCVECGLLLPLRRPDRGATGQSWACACCGARYRGVYDDSISPDVCRNARVVSQVG